MNGPIGSSQAQEAAEAFIQNFRWNLTHTLGTSLSSPDPRQAYRALSLTVRQVLVERYYLTLSERERTNPRSVYFLSLEYLPGKLLRKALVYCGLEDAARQALAALGLDLARIEDLDIEPALGAGGLARQAACLLDAMATQDIPAVGYGLRYEMGVTRQAVRQGWQVDAPQMWAADGNPWEFTRPEDVVEVGLYGYADHYTDRQGSYRVRWLPGISVTGEPFETLVSGFGTDTVNILRTWRARPSSEYDFHIIDIGDYVRAVEQKIFHENVTKVLYPADPNPQVKELRLKQEYFLAACTLRDILRRFSSHHASLEQLPQQAVIHLHETHLAIAIPELMRILIDESMLEWEDAWEITNSLFSCTCFGLPPDSQEMFPVGIFERMLPRHMEIILEINRRLLDEVRRIYPGDGERIARMSLIEEWPERQVRMGNLAAVGCFSISAASRQLFSILTGEILRDFSEMWPERFHYFPGSASTRRFLRLSNPSLAQLITRKIGRGWLRDADQLRALEAWAGDPDFQHAWRQVRLENKKALAAYVRQVTHLEIDPASMYQVNARQVQEHKRLLLEVLYIIHLYHQWVDVFDTEGLSRTFIISGKAGVGQRLDRLVIKLVHSLAEVINTDPGLAGKLKVVFLEDLKVSLAERLYPAADVAGQLALAGLDLAGFEAIKFAMNGALVVGALGGLNIELRELVGLENFFLFGLTAEEARDLRTRGYHPYDYYSAEPGLKRAIDSLAAGQFSFGDPDVFKPLVDSLLYRDEFMVLADFRSFVACQDRLVQIFADPVHWTRMSILNTARTGYLSSDRGIQDYRDLVWKISPVADHGSGG